MSYGIPVFALEEYFGLNEILTETEGVLLDKHDLFALALSVIDLAGNPSSTIELTLNDVTLNPLLRESLDLQSKHNAC